MSQFPIFRYGLDLTGTKPENLVTFELVQLANVAGNRTIAPKYGAYYASSMKVRHTGATIDANALSNVALTGIAPLIVGVIDLGDVPEAPAKYVVLSNQDDAGENGIYTYVVDNGGMYTLTSVSPGSLLTAGSQYKSFMLNQDATRASGGKFVDQLLVITDEDVQGFLVLEYQAVGGIFSVAPDVLEQLIIDLDLDNRPVNWHDIIELPPGFNPVPHYHHSSEFFGYGGLISAIERMILSVQDLTTGQDIQSKYIPGSKRQCIRYGDVDSNNNPSYLTYDGTVVSDPDNDSPPDIIFKHLFHFVLDIFTTPDDVYPLLYWQSISGTVSVDGSGGVAGTSRIELTTASTSYGIGGRDFFNMPTNIRLPLYSAQNYWSESFVWWPNGNVNSQRNVFRHVTLNDDISYDGGLKISVKSNVSPVTAAARGALCINFSHAAGETTVYVQKANIDGGSGFVNGNSYAIELYYKNGFYFVYINGVSKQLATISGGTTSDAGDPVNGYNPNPGNSNISMFVLNSKSLSTQRYFGGDGGNGCKGFIDEYAFKSVTSGYDPTNTINIGDAPIVDDGENTISGSIQNEIGSVPDVTINAVNNNGLAVSFANALVEFNNALTDTFIFEDLPLNNRCYLYLENTVISGEGILNPKITLNPPFNGLKFNRQGRTSLFVDQENIDGDDVVLLKDYYGNTWEFDSAVVPLTYDTDIDGNGSARGYLELSTTSAILISDIKTLGSRWCIQIAFIRPDDTKFGTLFQTVDASGNPTSDIKVEYLNTAPRLVITINGVSTVIDEATFITNAFADETAISFLELFYTGYKYGIRFMTRANGNATSEIWLDPSDTGDVGVDNDQAHGLANIYFLPLASDPVVLSSGSRFAIGDGSTGALQNLRVINFNIMPFVMASHPGLEGTPVWSWESNDNKPTAVNTSWWDRTLSFFNKTLMRTQFIDDPATALNSLPSFINDDSKSILCIGYADLDQGGVRNIEMFNFNGKYESEWIPVNSNGSAAASINVKHAIGDKDIDVRVYLNTSAEDEGAWLDSGIHYVGATESYGIGVKDIDDVNLTLIIGSDSITNLGSSPNIGTAVTSGFMKVSVTRNW